jgi:D-amino-acid dehydrogenase
MTISVIGAGVVGLACAYELSELGQDVTVIDSDAVGAGASAGNAGWITPFLSTPRAAPGAVGDALRSFANPDGPARLRPHVEAGFATWVAAFVRASTAKRNAKGTAALQNLAHRAHEHVDALAARGVGFEQYTDGLVVAFKRRDNLERYQHVVTKIRGLGYTGAIATYRGSDIASFDPAIHRSVAAVLHLESERHVRPETLTQGLAKSLLANGGRIVEHDAARRVERYGRQWMVVTESGQRHVSDTVLVAAAYPTRRLLRPLGVTVPLEAAKGTSMTARGLGTAPLHPLKLFENMVACSPFGDSVRLSGTFDIGARDFTLNRKRLDMVVRQALTYLDSWRPTDVEVEWVGHRPTSVDDLPIIGPVPGHDGLYVATGHGTLGVTLGPVTGALVAREIAHRRQQPELQPFRLTRF